MPFLAMWLRIATPAQDAPAARDGVGFVGEQRAGTLARSATQLPDGWDGLDQGLNHLGAVDSGGTDEYRQWEGATLGALT